MDRLCTECGGKINDSLQVILMKPDYTSDLCKRCWDKEWEKCKGIIQDKEITKLEKRIKVLEQGYPNEEELKKLKVGGTD